MIKIAEEEKKEEEKKEEEKPAEEPATPKVEDDTYEAEDLIDKANLAAERIEKASEEMSKNLDRQERQSVEKTLSGKAKATGPQEKEETDEEYAERVMSGEVEPKDY